MQIAAASAPFLDSLRPRFRALASEPAGEDLVLPGHDYRKVELRRFQGVKNEFLHASALTTVGAEFGRLEPADFERLHRQFGGRSQVAYDASRSYTIRDFLPPALRALVNQDLELPEPVRLSGSTTLSTSSPEEDKTVDLTMNCHAAAWAAMRAYQGDDRAVEIFNGEMGRDSQGLGMLLAN